jgi:hypothetical protein
LLRFDPVTYTAQPSHTCSWVFSYSGYSASLLTASTENIHELRYSSPVKSEWDFCTNTFQNFWRSI